MSDRTFRFISGFFFVAAAVAVILLLSRCSPLLIKRRRYTQAKSFGRWSLRKRFRLLAVILKRDGFRAVRAVWKSLRGFRKEVMASLPKSWSMKLRTPRAFIIPLRRMERDLSP